MNITTDRRGFSLPRLRVGVLSDSQLNCSRRHRRSVFELNLTDAFRTMKRLGVTFLVFAGDICNTAGKTAYRKFKKCLAEGFDGEVPPVLCVMGNHDYYMRAGTREGMRRLFAQELKQQPYAHFVINGYHFIAASPDCGSMHRGYEGVRPWLEERLNEAEQDGSDRPVFVITHNSPRNTVYGSDEWGDDSLTGIFEGHPRVVNFAGHSHYPQTDCRAVWLGRYTAFGTGATSYAEMERGKVNGSVPPEAHTAPMGWVADIRDDTAEVSLYNMKSGEREGVSVTLGPVRSAAPLCSSDAEPPVMPARAGEWSKKNGTAEISFLAAGGAHSYKVVYSDGVTQEYFSDFWKGTAATEKQCLTLYGKKRGIYELKVYAVNSCGKTSDCCTIIKKVEIRRRRRYRRRLAPDVVY